MVKQKKKNIALAAGEKKMRRRKTVSWREIRCQASRGKRKAHKLGEE